MSRFSEEKVVTVSFIYCPIDEWYFYLVEQELQMREVLSDGASIPVRAFVTYDTAGYFLEFDWFYEDDRNAKILGYLR